MQLEPTPDAATLHKIKLACVDKLAALGIVSTKRAVRKLLTAHHDDVFDRMFEHCGMIRVRVADDRVLTIMPGGTKQ